jgi:4-amino-4-deoxy-L-arabinose transferase-like glycosyltransferase
VTRRRRHAWLGAILAAVLVHGIFFALYLVPWEDESGYLVLGGLAVRGEISLYQDEMLGERLPLPFYVLGASEWLAGPSLTTARLASLLLGLAAVALVHAVARRMGGEAAGFLAALFLATQSFVVAYYATAMYHALCTVIVLLGLYAMFVRQAPLVGMAIFSLLSLTRPNMAVAVPLVLAYLWRRSPDRRHRAWLLAWAVVPLLTFFVVDPRHLKLLAYVPIVHRLVEPLGYVSLLRLGGEALAGSADWWATGVLWFGRRYVTWIAAAVGLCAAAAVARVHGRRPVGGAADGARFVAVLIVYLLAWQCVILRAYPKSVTAWSASFAALGALLLGYHAARLLHDPRVPTVLRGAMVAGLGLVFAVGPTISTHANMPRPLPAGTTMDAVTEAASRLRRMVPEGSRVFLVGMSLLPHLAGSRPYLQQIIHSWTLVPRGEPTILQRSGLWSLDDIDRWLGSEAPFAVIQTDRLAAWRSIPTYAPLAGRIDELLASRFRLVGEIEVYPLGRYRVYERPTPPRAAGPPGRG